MRLELDAADAEVRRRLERQWTAGFRLRRALQRDAAARCRAYWAADRARAQDPKALRDRLGLTRKGIEAAAKAHIDRSGWLRHHLTKAVGLHVADEVWQTVDRHLFADATGRRQGAPRVGSWWNFTRIPGRARSHTKPTPVWETWRLVGTLDGHLTAYRHPQLAPSVSTAAEAAGQPAAGLGSGSTVPLVSADLACCVVVARLHRRVGGGLQRTSSRGSGPTCAAAARVRAVGLRDAFSLRSGRVAQDRPSAGPRPSCAWRVALLRSFGRPSRRLSIPGDSNPPVASSCVAPRRHRRQRVQFVGGVVSRPAPRRARG